MTEELDAKIAEAEKKGASGEEWRKLMQVMVQRGRTRDADLQAFVPHLATAVDGELDLSGCSEVTDTFLKMAVAAWPDVRVLRLDHIKRIGEDGLRAAVTGLQHLETLSLRFATGLTEKALLVLATAAWPLKTLLLSGTGGVSEQVLTKIFGNAKLCATVENLDVSHLHPGAVTPAVVRHIAHSLPMLTSLGMSWTSAELGDGASKLPKHCHKLVRIGLADSKTTEATLAKLLTANPGITAIDVSGCVALLQSGCEKVAKQLGAVRSLSCGSSALSDQTLARLVAGAAASLEELDIIGSHKLTPEGLHAALEPAKALRVLTIGSCKLIPEKTVVALKEASPALRIFYVYTKP